MANSLTSKEKIKSKPLENGLLPPEQLPTEVCEERVQWRHRVSGPFPTAVHAPTCMDWSGACWAVTPQCQALSRTRGAPKLAASLPVAEQDVKRGFVCVCRPEPSVSAPESSGVTSGALCDRMASGHLG